MISVKFAIEHEQRNLLFYVHSSEDPYIMQVATNYPHFVGHGRQYKKSDDMERLQTWKSKPLHGQFFRETEDRVCVKMQWSLLRFGNISKKMEGLLFAAQEQALSTNAIKHIFIIVSVQPGADYVVE